MGISLKYKLLVDKSYSRLTYAYKLIPELILFKEKSLFRILEFTDIFLSLLTSWCV